jgi:hypothetical protein
MGNPHYFNKYKFDERHLWNDAELAARKQGIIRLNANALYHESVTFGGGGNR